jgi:hypothetical protein
VGLLRVVPKQVLHQRTVEGSRVVQLIEMPVGELLLKGPVEALQMAIRLGMLGIVEEVYQMVRSATLSEVILELTTVISLDVGNLEGSHLKELVKEISAIG